MTRRSPVNYVLKPAVIANSKPHAKAYRLTAWGVACTSRSCRADSRAGAASTTGWVKAAAEVQERIAVATIGKQHVRDFGVHMGLLQANTNRVVPGAADANER